MCLDFLERNTHNSKNYEKNFIKTMGNYNIQQIDDDQTTCTRGADSSLDHIFSTGQRIEETKYRTMKTSDHKMVISRIKLDMRPIIREDKQMIYSNLVNEPKLKHLQYILRYNLELWKLVHEDRMNRTNHRKALTQLTNNIPVIQYNKAT